MSAGTQHLTCIGCIIEENPLFPGWSSFTVTEREQLEQAIAALEAQRALLGDGVIEAGLAPMRQRLATLAAPPPQEERKLVTMLFADVSGFTAMMEHRDPEDVREIM